MRKIVWLWRPDSDVLVQVASYGRTPLPSRAVTPLRLILDVSYLAVVMLAAAALLRFRQFGRSLTFVLVLVTFWTAAHVVFFGEPRYHLPLLTVLTPMAATSPLGIIEYFRSRRYVGLVLTSERIGAV